MNIRDINEINIIGVPYKIVFYDNPSQVDINNREALWGSIDYWTRTIRLFENGRPDQDILQTMLHEVIHAIEEQLHLKDLSEDVVDCLALGLADTLIRNNMIILDKGE